MTNLEGKLVVNWLIMSQQIDYLEFYTSNAVEAGLKGKYYLNLNITDEFKEVTEIKILLDVDYTTLHYITQNLKLAVSIIGPIFSVLAGIAYFRHVYNFMWRNSCSITDQVVYLKEKFKIKIPLIGDEIKVAESIFLKLNEKDLRRLKEGFLNMNFSEQIEEITIKNTDIMLPEEEKGTICCLLEGFVVRELLFSDKKGFLATHLYDEDLLPSTSNKNVL